VIDDLLGQLRGDTRRGAGREVDKHPTPSTRGTAHSSEVGGREQIEGARRRAFDGSYTAEDVWILRGLTRVPWTLTNAVPCGEDCPHVGRRRHYGGVEIGDSVCDVDGTCWVAESEARRAFAREHGREAVATDANYRRGVVQLRVVETAPELPIERLARGKVGHPPKMTDEQIESALAELDSGEITPRALARREWQRWGFKSYQSAEQALRRYRRLRNEALEAQEVEVAA
jgi:hypothetical protein